jgi:endonuclease-3
MAILPRERWTRTTDLLIFHGRKICIARRPLCGQCPVFALCRWPARQAFAQGKPPRARGAPGRTARRRARRAPARRKARRP